MRISINRDDLGYTSDLNPATTQITLNGEIMDSVMTADEERGFVDVMRMPIIGGSLGGEFHFNTPRVQRHRLWGEVEIIWTRHT